MEDVMITGSLIIQSDCRFVQELLERGINTGHDNQSLVSPPPYTGKALVIGELHGAWLSSLSCLRYCILLTKDTHTHTRARSRARTHSRTHTHTRTRTHTLTHTHAHTRTRTHARAHAHARTHARTHTHTHTHAHTHCKYIFRSYNESSFDTVRFHGNLFSHMQM